MESNTNQTAGLDGRREVFILRLWQESEDTVWRGEVRHIHANPHYVRSPGELLDYLNEMMSAGARRPSSKLR